MAVWSWYRQRLSVIGDIVQRAAPEVTAPFEPSPLAPPGHVLRAAAAVPRTPAVLWDLGILRARARWLRNLLAEHRIELSVALKACNTGEVLSLLREEGLSADVATMEEYLTARDIAILGSTGVLW